MAADSTFRWPYDQISSSASGSPTNGLSSGTDPSRLSRTVVPRWFPRSCAGSNWNRSPRVRNRWPSGEKAIREPKWLGPVIQGSSVKSVSNPWRLSAVQRPRPTGRRRAPPGPGPGEREVDVGLLGEVGVEGHVEEAALPLGEDRRRAADGVGERPVPVEDAEPARPLGHEGPAVGEERHRPRALEPADHVVHGDGPGLGDHGLDLVAGADLGAGGAGREGGGGEGGEDEERTEHRSRKGGP